MNRYRLHLFVCTNVRPPFAKPSCAPKDSHQMLLQLKTAVEEHDLKNEVRITGCGCLGPCEDGVVMVAYPEGTWYSGVTLSDIPELIEEHILSGRPVQRLLHDWQHNHGS